MEKFVEQTLLYDFYGELLTERQQQVYETVVLEDYSLSEVAEELGISRQGVHDMIRRCNHTLEEYEGKLHLVEKFIRIRDQIRKIQVGIDGKNFLARLDVFFACVGQGEGVGGTVENRSSQIAFYQFDHLTEGGLGNIKPFGGACDAAFLINGKHVLSVFRIHKTS